MLAMLTADMESAFYRRILRSRHFDGLIMFSSDIDDPILPLLIKDGGPLVLIGRHPYFINVVSIDVNNREGARDGVNHLIALGHRRIGLINGQLQMEAALARRDGYKQALLEAGIGIDAALMVDGHFSDTAAYVAMLSLLDLAQPPTAVFSASDGMAVGALQAIRDRGLRVPDDVALIGYDDLPLAARSTPTLTSMHQPIGEMGSHAVRVLVEQIKGHESATSVRLPARLVVRESSGGEVADRCERRICTRQRCSDARQLGASFHTTGLVKPRYAKFSTRKEEGVLMLRRTLLSWGVTLSLLGLLASNALTATYAAAAPVSQTTPSATPTPVAVDTFDPSVAGGRPVVKWYARPGHRWKSKASRSAASGCRPVQPVAEPHLSLVADCRQHRRVHHIGHADRCWQRTPTSLAPSAQPAARHSMAITSISRRTFSPTALT